MSPSLAEHESGLSDWIIRFATTVDEGDQLLDAVCAKLCRGGLPLWRVSIAVPTIDPLYAAASLNWRRDGGMSIATAAHGAESDAAYHSTPVASLLSTEQAFGRWRLSAGEGCATYPLLDALRTEGGTDYAMFVVKFSPATALAGAALSIATDRDGGFTADDIETVERILPALGLGIYRQLMTFGATQALNSYLGPMTGAKVLAGHLRRGEGEVIAAAILLADLAGFTALADREPPRSVVRWLNEHLEGIGEPVIEGGGEILKFLGDGFLAVFPTDLDAPLPCSACESALRAAEAALARNAALNARRASLGEPQLDVHVALHFGEVVYGNIGTKRRLDFTMIGGAVNETSRIEKLCDEVGVPLLVSEDFAQRCHRPFEPKGLFKLRGVDRPRLVLTTA